jgi:hypothetical protein
MKHMGAIDMDRRIILAFGYREMMCEVVVLD